ncbi:MAG: signal peptidase I [Clostridia bacterium]|nr:signal peptidase I [Clostridia bacterium]
MNEENMMDKQLNKPKKVIGDIIVVVSLLLVLALLYLATNFWLSVHVVKNVSMQTTLNDGDIVLADKFATPKHGNVIIFKYDDDTDYIKRVIATEGDTLYFEKKNGEWVVYIKYKGEALREVLNEPYLKEGTITEYRGTSASIVVGEDELFVMGDNREESYDSRDFGLIKKEQVKGVVHNFFIYTKGVNKLIFSNSCVVKK